MLRKLTLALVTSAAIGAMAQSATAAETSRQIGIEPTGPVASLGTQKNQDQKNQDLAAADRQGAPQGAATDPAADPQGAPKGALNDAASDPQGAPQGPQTDAAAGPAGAPDAAPEGDNQGQQHFAEPPKPTYVHPPVYSQQYGGYDGHRGYDGYRGGYDGYHSGYDGNRGNYGGYNGDHGSYNGGHQNYGGYQSYQNYSRRQGGC